MPEIVFPASQLERFPRRAARPARGLAAEPNSSIVGCRAGAALASSAAAALDNGRKIQESVAYMIEHLNQPLKVPQLASMAHVSASHYFALFKGRMRCSPIDFFIRLRMNRAGRLLVESSLPVKDIAAQLGYDDHFYFSRLLKSVHAVAPTEYRTNCRGGADVATTTRPGT